MTASTPCSSPRETPRRSPRATPLARRLAQSQGSTQGVTIETLFSSNKVQGKIKAADVLDALEARQGTSEQGTSGQEKNETRLFASPRARVRAAEASIDLAPLQGRGSGPRGRIIQQDVEQAARQGLSQGLSPFSSPLSVETPFELRPHTRMREVIAERLTLSKQTIPHFTLTIACRIDALLSLREQINRRLQELHRLEGAASEKPFKVSLNDLLVKGLALSLEMCSQDDVAVNVAWTDEGLKHFQRVDVAVAVAIPGGLITPIVRDAANKPLLVLARELHALIASARLGKLQPEDYTGGSVSISNLGMFGIQAFQAIINPPQAAILAVGAAEKVLTKNSSCEIVEETRISATLSADHRAIDGAAAAQLCERFKQVIEQPVGLILDHLNVM